MGNDMDITKALPKEAWNKLAATACESFEKLIYPLTATTEGIGRLIEQRFTRLADEQKIIAAKCLAEVSEKVASSRKQTSADVVVKPAVVYEALDNTDNQTDQTIRTLWANLLANEFLEGDVHPEIARLLSRITAKDALLLSKIAEEERSTLLGVKVLKALASKTTLGVFDEKKTFNHVHLEKLGLITRVENVWISTAAGEELMRCVSDPE